MAAFTLPALSPAEPRNQQREMLQRLGAARDTLWIAALSDITAERNHCAIWGSDEPARGGCGHQPGQPAASVAGVQADGEDLRGSQQVKDLRRSTAKRSFSFLLNRLISGQRLETLGLTQLLVVCFTHLRVVIFI
jgi:hypothetical protein